jgi:hypothetical protein
VLESLDHHMARRKPTFVMVEWGRQIGSKRNNGLDQTEGFTNTRCGIKVRKERNRLEITYLKSLQSSNEFRICWKVGVKYKNGYGKVAGRKNKGMLVIVMDTNHKQKH